MSLHNLPAYRKTYACAWVLFSGMKTLEYNKDLLEEFRGYAYAIVLYRENPLILIQNSGNMNARRFLTPVLDSVAKQVLEQLDHLHGISHYYRKRVMGYLGIILFNSYFKI